MTVWVVTDINTGEVVRVTDYDPQFCERPQKITECEVQTAHIEG